jgi:hypothetical protein
LGAKSPTARWAGLGSVMMIFLSAGELGQVPWISLRRRLNRQVRGPCSWWSVL